MAETMPLSENEPGGGDDTPIEITLQPLQLLYAAQAGFARGAPGADFETALPRGYIVFRQLSPPLELRGLDFWLRFGQMVPLTRDGRHYVVTVAKFLDVHRSFISDYAHQSVEPIAQFRTFVERMEAYLGVSQGQARGRDVLARYHELKPTDQAEGIRLVRQSFARAKLANSFAAPTIETFSKQIKANADYNASGQWRVYVALARKVRAEFALDEPLFTRLFENYYWENAACPAAAHPGIIRYLPPSPRQRAEDEEEEGGPPVEPPLEPPPVEIAEDDIRVVPPAEAGTRFEFYKKVFGCKVVVRPKKLFGKEEHNYFGYLVKTRNGTWFLIVDCDKYGCAAYIFKIDPNDPLRYVLDVQLPRYELLRIKAARLDPNPPADKAQTFVDREFHNETITARMERRWRED